MNNAEVIISIILGSAATIAAMIKGGKAVWTSVWKIATIFANLVTAINDHSAALETIAPKLDALAESHTKLNETVGNHEIRLLNLEKTTTPSVKDPPAG